ncbi:hypothetical protein MKCMC460_56890 [Mycobacterium sp. 20KCMC460]|uniref:Uncharacterized protein n=2 Tax=Mycobacteriaceae TaxID=1762 RepID=A0A9P3Q9M3_9MYCO|nr:hypothetical protein IWGMT90018_58110 [Mycobacterium kiyosense]BDE16829.1 hypothetical protein MKCMC460_56890 [Mycobacterium sp. 20KCMC460]GLB83087.1 hypothetical protein SRL2020028_23430 [Mycobacterium kiyosense]GLB97403.1 hypothetical protein SRL2020226_41790 [Mycobacterium kiyosense]GLC02874.1 hypothetical protein SRL2020400_34650 [Mycobacterium kiyosense]
MQAAILARMLRDTITEISGQLDTPPHRRRPSASRNRHHRVRRDADLRRELHEAHQMLDNLRHRFPRTRPHSPAPLP